LEAQVELLLLQLHQLIVELVERLVPDLASLHSSNPLAIRASRPQARRVTILVLIGSFAAPRIKASRATASVTPSSSNMMRPGLTRATHSSGEPLPEPIRTSAGFFDTGTSGKMRIQTRPA